MRAVGAVMHAYTKNGMSQATYVWNKSVAEAERSVQERSRSLKMLEQERYKTEQSLHR